MLHGYPRERAVFVVAQRSAVQRWVAGHESLDVHSAEGLFSNSEGTTGRDFVAEAERASEN